MSKNDKVSLNCPAMTRGVAGCRFCIFIPGGASNLCMKMIEVGRKQREKERAKSIQVII